MNTTVYLIRHSIKLDNDYINEYNTPENRVIKDEKIILSVEGEKRAEILSNEKELQNLDVIYSSNFVRALQTAKYFMEKQNLKVNIDDRFDELKSSILNFTNIKDRFTRRYLDENFKTEGSESQKDVRERFSEAFYEMLEKNRGKRIAIFTHGYALSFFILKWCELLEIDESKRRKISFKGKVIEDKKMNAPDVFKLEFDENDEMIDIENIEFEDLPYRYGGGI